jgi:hypothetical protein
LQACRYCSAAKTVRAARQIIALHCLRPKRRPDDDGSKDSDDAMIEARPRRPKPSSVSSAPRATRLKLPLAASLEHRRLQCYMLMLVDADDRRSMLGVSPGAIWRDGVRCCGAAAVLPDRRAGLQRLLAARAHIRRFSRNRALVSLLPPSAC